MNRVPKPKIACPRAERFNEIVTLDLKDVNDSEKKENRYILYMIDMFSRLTVGVFIKDKHPETVANKILKHWVGAGFGLMRFIHSDLGGEFVNKTMTDVADYLNVRLTTTAAHSPNMNGCNERNHATVDRMMSKMMDEDKNLSAETALCWALNAKNSLENNNGYSPFQLVFGESPKLPSVFTAGPPGLEEVVMNKKIAEHINAMHSAREAFIKCESDKVLKQALKSRIYVQGKNIVPGDWIYFKNNTKKWEGPVKITTKDGKLLYAVRNRKLLTINIDHATLAKFEGEFQHQNQSTDNTDFEEYGKHNNSGVPDEATSHYGKHNKTVVSAEATSHYGKRIYTVGSAEPTSQYGKRNKTVDSAEADSH